MYGVIGISLNRPLQEFTFAENLSRCLHPYHDLEVHRGIYLKNSSLTCTPDVFLNRFDYGLITKAKYGS